MAHQEETIAILNTLVRVKVAPSKIHGVGLFAIRDIPKGTKLYANMFPQAYKIPFGSFRKLFPDIREMLLERWPNIVNGSAFMYPDTLLQAYCNHSEDNNYDGITDMTIKDIEEGEEITENYKQIPNWEKVFKWLK